MRRHSSEPSRAPSPPRSRHRALRAVMIALAVVVVVAVGACGGDSSPPAGIADPGATASVPVPDWYTAPFRPPAGSVPVESIEKPDPGVGRSVTWRVPGGFDDTLGSVERNLRSLGWSPTDRKDASESGTRRTSYYLENDQVYAVYVYSDDALSGVRLTVELPAPR